MTLEDLIDTGLGDDQIHVDVRRPPALPAQGQDQYEMQPYNPFSRVPYQTWDDRTMDRMITIKRPKGVKSGELWITESGFAEVLSLLPLNKKEQKEYWRKFRKIQMIYTGELSAKMVDSRQERLCMELVSQKSRLDVAANGNLNEREMWITNRNLIEQTLRTPPPQQPKGFVGSVLSGITGR